MKKVILTLIMAVALCSFVTNAQALVPTEKGVYDVWEAINDVIYAATGTLGTYTSNEDIDEIQVKTGDTYWSDLSTENNDEQGPYIAIGVSAWNSNDMQVYSVSNPGDTSLVFSNITSYPTTGFVLYTSDGTNATPYIKFGYSDLSGEPDFGWQIESEAYSGSLGANYTWDSDPTKNIDGYDHMLTYDLGDLLFNKTIYYTLDGGETVLPYTFNKPYLVAWEDLPDLEYDPESDVDYDYNDMLYLIDNVEPVRNVVPEPASMALLGTGLLGLFGFRRKRS